MTLPAMETAPLNPFPGLRPFEPEEDYLFFGRERQTDQLLKKLRTTRFLSILGRSGSGKSSLVRSGLIPRLYGGGMTVAGSRWRVAVLRPGEDPIGNLARALASPEAIGPPDDEEEMTLAFFETTLRASQRGIVECIQQVRLPAADNVLILVDQFEELFRYKASRRASGRDEAVAFVKLLLNARASDVPCYISITMRSDFVGDSMEFGDLPEVINSGLYLVPRMTRDELRSAIVGPIAVGGGTIAPRLVSRLLNDVGDDPDQLPILQHALMRTWERWELDHEPGEPVDLRHYEAIGTMHSALSGHAEEAFAELTPAQQRIAEIMFKALTDRGTDVRGVRRPAAVREICALTGASLGEVTAVVDAFRRAGRSFVMPPAGAPLREESILDISHESLMRIWTRLSGWADDEAKSAQLYLGVAEAAERHEQGVAGLWRDPELQLALTWREKEKPTEQWAARYDPAFARAMTFLDDSKEERDRELREKEARRRRELRRARVLVAVFAVAALLMLGLGAYAFVLKQRAVAEEQHAVDEAYRANKAREAAIAARAHAQQEQQRAEAQRNIATQQTQIAEGERAKAQQQTQVAESERARAESEKQRAEGEQARADEASQKANANATEARASAAKAAAAQARAEDQQQKAENAKKEAERLRMLDSARAYALEIGKSDANDDTIRKALAAYMLNRRAQGPDDQPDIFGGLLGMLAKVQPFPVRAEQDSIRSLVVAPDGKSAVTGSEDGRVLRIALEGNAPPATLGTFPTPVRAVALRPGGDLVAAASEGGEVRLLELRRPGAAPRTLGQALGTVTSLAFDPSGTRLAAGSLTGKVTIWNLDASAPPVTLSAPEAKSVISISFNRLGRELAAALGRGGAVMWDLGTPGSQYVVYSGRDVRSVAFDPANDVLACGTADGTVHLMGGRLPIDLPGHRSAVNSFSFDRSGSLLASASSDGTVRIWNVTEKSPQPVVLTGHQSWVWSVAFTPDGQRLVSGGQDRTLRTWPAHASLAAGMLCGYANAHIKNLDPHLCSEVPERQ